MAIPALSRRASIRLPSSRFQPLLSEPGVPISGTGLSSGIMRLVHEPPAIRACRWSDSPTSAAAAARRPLCIPSRVRRAVEPVHASTTSNLYGSTPSLMHVMFPESLPTRGLRHRHSRRPSSFNHPSTPEVGFSDIGWRVSRCTASALHTFSRPRFPPPSRAVEPVHASTTSNPLYGSEAFREPSEVKANPAMPHYAPAFTPACRLRPSPFPPRMGGALASPPPVPRGGVLGIAWRPPASLRPSSFQRQRRFHT